MKDLSEVLFITDMDGTLLKHDKTVHHKDMEAIEKFRAMGGHFSLATGRSLQSAEQYFPVLKISEPVILCNGGGIYDCSKKNFVWEKFVDKSALDIVRKVFEEFPSVGMEIDLSDKILVPRMSDKEKYHLEISYDGKYVPADLDVISPDGWCKVLFAAEEEEIPPLIEFVTSLKNDKSVYVRSSRYFYEILPKNCTKGKTLDVLRELYPDIKKICAFGDFDNDLEMIENADFGFAPANAQDCVKSAADYVTSADCDNGAAAEALNYVMNVL